MNAGNVADHAKSDMSMLIRDANEHDDAQLSALVAETMPSNGMVLSFQRSPSYFQAAFVQYSCPEIKVMCLKEQPEKIIAIMNIGFKKCYINNEISQIRYVSDLRIVKKYRGMQTIELMMDYLHSHIAEDEFLQSIVLEDNHLARHMMHKSRPHFPQPYIHDEITTYNISKVPQSFQTDQFKRRVLSKELIPAVNQFVDQMKYHFNFMPNYEFNELLNDQSGFWRGLALDNFSVIFEKEQIVGLMGIWNQKSFKQTKVVEYSTRLKWLKPLYNAYANLTGRIKLPQYNEDFEYLMTHSVLCEPSRLEVFAYQLFLLNKQCKALGQSSYCITLSRDDPRKKLADRCQSHKMHAIHALHSFKANPLGQFDRSKVSYFEVGRI